MALAQQAALSGLLDDHVKFTDERIVAGTANPAGKLTSIIAGLAAGADSIDDLQVTRTGGMNKLFGGVYAPSTLGILLREFTHGHVRQLDAALSRHAGPDRPGRPAGRDRGAGPGGRGFVAAPGVRPRQQGASFGHTKIAGRQVLRKGLSRLAVTISTEQAAPVIAAVRLRGGKSGSGKGAASILTQDPHPSCQHREESRRQLHPGPW